MVSIGGNEQTQNSGANSETPEELTVTINCFSGKDKIAVTKEMVVDTTLFADLNVMVYKQMRRKKKKSTSFARTSTHQTR